MESILFTRTLQSILLIIWQCIDKLMSLKYLTTPQNNKLSQTLTNQQGETINQDSGEINKQTVREEGLGRLPCLFDFSQEKYVHQLIIDSLQSPLTQ